MRANVKRIVQEALRPAPSRKGVTGQGMYTGHGKFNLKGLGREVKQIGRGAIRQVAQKGLAALIGSGAYSFGDAVHTNALVEDIAGGSHNISARYHAPNDETGSVILTKREYIGDIFGPSTPFNVQSYSLNPGLSTVFDWLAQIAANYEQYEFIQLVAEFRSTTTDIGSSSNGQCGTIVMATNYNAAADPFTDKIQMMEYAGSQSSKTTEHMLHGIECDRKKVALSTSLYVRTGPVSGGQDIKTYDHGRLQVAVCNSPSGFANQVLGELWIYYMVRVSVPKLVVARGLNYPRDVWVTRSSAGNATSANLFGPFSNIAYSSNQQNNLGAKITPLNTGVMITFPASFAGAVRVYINCRLLATATENFFPGIGPYTGNVSVVSDMAGTGFTISDIAGKQITTGDAANVDVSLYQHLYVKPATPGTDNTVTLLGTVGGTSSIQSYLEVELFNSFGINSASGRPVWVDTAGNTSYP